MSVLIHPGYHKTATTFLQNSLFNATPVFRQPWPRELIYRTIWHPDEFDFDAAAARHALADAARTMPPAHIDVLSEENLSGNPFDGARERGIMARKLRAVFEDVKILFTIREQSSLIRSLYMQYLKMGGRLSIEKAFGNYPLSEFFGFSINPFCYHNLVEYYAELFGEHNIIVLPQELLQKEEARFVELLADFLGVAANTIPHKNGSTPAVNVSIPPSGIPFLRLANFFRNGPYNEHGLKSLGLTGKAIVRLARHQRWLFRGNDQRIAHFIAENFGGRFAQSNVRLQKFVPVPLKDFGYE